MAIFTHLRAATKRQQELLDAADAAGWTVAFVPFPNAVGIGHPANGIEIPTPDYVAQSMWPGKTYSALHQLTLMFDVLGPKDGEGRTPVKITHVFKRECPAPWVRCTESDIGLGKAIEWIRADHPAQEVTGDDPLPAGR